MTVTSADSPFGRTELWNKSKSDLQLATVTYDRIQALYKDSVVTQPAGKMKWKPCIKLLLPPNGRRINNLLVEGRSRRDKECPLLGGCGSGHW